MRRTRLIVLLLVLLCSIGVSWLWWIRPKKVDMAAYAPANSLLYLESNRPLAIAQVVSGTDAWKALDKTMGAPPRPQQNEWFQRFVGWTGIGPIQSVILARSQLAVVITDLRTTEDSYTLSVKPEGAIIIETHTAESRIRHAVEESVKKLAEATYGKPTLRRTTIEGIEFIEWRSPEGSRQIVAAIIGSLVIIGNSEHAVQSCLIVALRRAPSLKDDPQLHRMRFQLSEDQAVSFGYVPPGNSNRLLAVGISLLLGRTPDDVDSQRLIGTGAGKIVGSLAWSAQPFRSGIEDRYLISLQPPIIEQLKPNLALTSGSNPSQRVLPQDVYSVTYYKFENPVAAWQGLKTAVSSQIDALSALVFSSLLKSALLPYGINEPEAFLRAVKGDVLTLRLDRNGERSMLIAGIRDRTGLREVVTGTFGFNIRSNSAGGVEMFEDSAGEVAVIFVDDFVLLGSSSDVRRYSENMKRYSAVMGDDELRKVTFFVPLTGSAPIVTYTNDGDRVRSFVAAMIKARGLPSPEPTRLEEIIDALPYSATQTTLGDHGLERITRSPLGQFSTLLPLVIPERALQSENSAQPQ